MNVLFVLLWCLLATACRETSGPRQVADPGAAVAAKDAAAVEAGVAAANTLQLPLRTTGPTLVVGRGAALETVDPQTGDRVGAITPFTIPELGWSQLSRAGHFLLAVGHGKLLDSPSKRFPRGMLLFDERGQVLWTRSDEVSPGAHRHVYLSEQGYVSYESLAGFGVLTPDGTHLDTRDAPAGPVLHGAQNVVPLRVRPAARPRVLNDLPERYTWQVVAPGDTKQVLPAPPDDVVASAAVVPQVVGQKIALVATLYPLPDVEVVRIPLKTLSTLPLPQECQHVETSIWAATSPRYYILTCWGQADRRFMIDVETETLRTLTLPRLPRPSWSSSEQTRIEILPDGTLVLAHWNQCDNEIHERVPLGRWRQVPVKVAFGPPVEPALLCGHLLLKPGAMPSNMGCGYGGGSRPPFDPKTVSYVRQPDGHWLTLPPRYDGGTNSCSPDAQYAAFVTNHSLRVARLDGPLDHEIAQNASAYTPFAWLP